MFRLHRLAPPAVALLLALLLALSACTTDDGPDDAAAGPVTVSGGFKPVINVAVNGWTASALNVAIAEAVIERHLGYPVVPVRIDDTTTMYQQLADGTLDAVLEVWPSAVTDRDQRFFDRGQVVDLGPLGSVGQIGWFVPRYVIEEAPELASWEGYRDPTVTARFAPVDDAPPGQFLGVLPSYRQHDEEIIANLGLPLEVVYSGSEEESLEALAEATAAGEPILVYWWQPTAAITAHDLVKVALPEPTEACLAAAEAGDGGVACDYPPEDLRKVASPELATRAPEVDAFLRAFTLTTEDQQAMLAAIEVEGRPLNEVAADWVAANEDRWRPWLAG